MRDAYFLYVDADLEECIQRIRQRAEQPTCDDDHDVPEEIMRGFYAEDDGAKLPEILAPYGVPAERVFTIKNDGGPQHFFHEVQQVGKTILEGCQQAKAERDRQLQAILALF